MRVTLKAQKAQERQEAVDRLREILKPGNRVFGVVKSVSRSGMTRSIDFYTFGSRVEHGRESGIDRVYLSGWIATALDYRRDDRGALRVEGCGMDMVFHVVYNLGRTLYPDGFGMPCEECGERKTDPEVKSYHGDTGKACKYRGRNGDRSGWDIDGGYALRYEAL